MTVQKEEKSKILKVTLLVSLIANIFIAGWFAGTFLTNRIVNHPPAFDRPGAFMPPPPGSMIMLPKMIRHGIANLSPEGQDIILTALIEKDLIGPPPGFVGQHQRIREIIEEDVFDEEAFDRETQVIQKQALARITATMQAFTSAFKKLSKEDKILLLNWRASMQRRMLQKDINFN